MDHPQALCRSSASAGSLSASLLPLRPSPPVSFPLFLSYLSELKSEASLSQTEQQDSPQETALDSSLSYICKVSPTHPSARSPHLFSIQFSEYC